MSVRSPVGRRRFATRGLLASLSLAFGVTIAVGSFLWAEPAPFAHESSSAVVFRAKPSMSRQPRPMSAPFRHLDQRADTAVVLLGIEPLDDSAGAATSTPPKGERTPRR